MRRSDREITAPEAIEGFISSEKIMRVGFRDNDDIYIVPVNYGYSVKDGSYTFYFHGAMEGRKYRLARSGPSVGFEIDGGYELIGADTACGHSARFMSVIGTGTLTVTDDEEERKAAFGYIMKQAAGSGEWEYRKDIHDRTAVFKLEVKTLSCKAK